MRLLLIIICFFSCSAEKQTGKVVKVIDGDTFDLMSDKKIRIRMFGIDSPERGQAYNVKAKEFAAKAAGFNPLPQLNYAFVRAKAGKLAGPQR